MRKRLKNQALFSSPAIIREPGYEARPTYDLSMSLSSFSPSHTSKAIADKDTLEINYRNNL